MKNTKYVEIERTDDGRIYIKGDISCIDVSEPIKNIQIVPSRISYRFSYIIFIHIYFHNKTSFTNSIIYTRPFLSYRKAIKIADSINKQIYDEIINTDSAKSSNKIGFIQN